MKGTRYGREKRGKREKRDRVIRDRKGTGGKEVKEKQNYQKGKAMTAD
jgi:hypothetical protein